MFQSWQWCTANNGYSLGVIWGKSCLYLFDSHSKNSSGNICQNGTSVLLKFETLSKLQEYVKDIYYVGLKHETLYFQIQFINLLCSSEEMKVIKSKVALERCLNFQKQKYAINAELKKKNHQSKLSSQNKSSVNKLKRNQDRVKLFKKQIWESPYFICTICHRCFYLRSVRLFSMVNYKDIKIDYVAQATYDGKVYVCMTCHKSIRKKRTPCQAVSNKLDVEVAPKQLQNLKKLEKVLTSKRILFKKVAIMHGKGEFSKIKRNICNIPVEIDTVCNVLPRPIK